MIQTNGIDHLVLHVQDVARAKKFYTELLGMTVYRENEARRFCIVATRSGAVQEAWRRAPDDGQ